MSRARPQVPDSSILGAGSLRGREYCHTCCQESMERLARETSRAMPSTLIGDLIRATTRADAEALARSRAELSRTRWSDAGSVVDSALAASLELALGPTPSLLGIPRIAIKTARTFKKANLRPRDVERVIRASLGEEMLLDKVRTNQVEAIRVLVFATIARDRKLTTEQLDALIAQAERRAREAGYQPTANATS